MSKKIYYPNDVLTADILNSFVQDAQVEKMSDENAGDVKVASKGIVDALDTAMRGNLDSAISGLRATINAALEQKANISGIYNGLEVHRAQYAGYSDYLSGANGASYENGYFSFPIVGSLKIYIQWGQNTVGKLGSVECAYPVAFPHACLILVSGIYGSNNSTSGGDFCYASTVSRSACRLTHDYVNSANSSTINYIAIGY